MPDDNPSDAGLLGKVKQKLIETKQKWAGEGRLLTGQTADPNAARLPPGQREVKNWPVLDLGIQPNVPASRWRLDVAGMVENPISWSWADFNAQPQEEFTSDIHCVTAWSRFDNRWQGVSTRHLLSIVRPKPEVRFVIQHSYDGYTTNVPLADFAADNVLLASKWEGQPIAREHGGPVRLVLPRLYFWKSAKWLMRLEFSDHDKPGFWEVRGYHNYGDPWKEERYS
ncbi:MAG TPA: sulfite oxidase-like oxidoreductase [Alphaproteobacteria bacterium]|nr:sulfite oxidase-like oxidoreductase [Alphaproteobacteria bacterium]